MTMCKKRIITGALLCVMILTLFVGLASAAAEPVASTYATYYNYSLLLPARGVTKVGEPIEKESSLDYAYFYVTSLSNSSGLSCYLNVRSSDGKYIVGTAAPVAGTGVCSVNYLAGYGSVGTKYCPSGQTDSDSSASATIGGKWRP